MRASEVVTDDQGRAERMTAEALKRHLLLRQYRTGRRALARAHRAAKKREGVTREQRASEAIEGKRVRRESDILLSALEEMRWISVWLLRAEEPPGSAGRRPKELAFSDKVLDLVLAERGPMWPVTKPPSYENLVRLARMLELLSPAQRQCVILVWGEGITAEEAASLLGISRRAVAYRLQGARATLDRALALQRRQEIKLQGRAYADDDDNDLGALMATRPGEW